MLKNVVTAWLLLHLSVLASDDVEVVQLQAPVSAIDGKPRRSELRKDDTVKDAMHIAAKAHLTLYRYNMLEQLKLLAAKNDQIRVTHPKEFNSEGFRETLPANGAVVFVVDDPFSSSDSTVRGWEDALDDPRILGLAAEDWGGIADHPKLTILPIGFESKVMTGKKPGLETLVELSKHPVPANKRDHRIQSDAQLHSFGAPSSKERDDRGSMANALEGKGVVDDWYEEKIEFPEHLKEHAARASFALCPEGNGLDTHRFYHNYAIHTRCIVRDGKQSSLHRQFPGTIVVEDWAEVTPENIELWKKDEVVHDPRILTAAHWISKVLLTAGFKEGQVISDQLSKDFERMTRRRRHKGK